jgi:hypothetical protein
MESSSRPDHVQLSAAAAAALRAQDPDLAACLQDRGAIPIKGKGEQRCRGSHYFFNNSVTQFFAANVIQVSTKWL